MRTLLTLALLAAAAPAAKPAKPFDFSGQWDSNQGAMSLAQKGARLTGTYAVSNGRVFATVKDQTADGWWTQSTSQRRCPAIKLDSHYWGRMQFIAQADGRSFNGEWSYCNDKLGSGGAWTGKRK